MFEIPRGVELSSRADATDQRLIRKAANLSEER